MATAASVALPPRAAPAGRSGWRTGRPRSPRRRTRRAVGCLAGGPPARLTVPARPPARRRPAAETPRARTATAAVLRERRMVEPPRVRWSPQRASRTRCRGAGRGLDQPRPPALRPRFCPLPCPAQSGQVNAGPTTGSAHRGRPCCGRPPPARRSKRRGNSGRPAPEGHRCDRHHDLVEQPGLGELRGQVAAADHPDGPRRPPRPPSRRAPARRRRRRSATSAPAGTGRLAVGEHPARLVVGPRLPGLGQVARGPTRTSSRPSRSRRSSR